MSKGTGAETFRNIDFMNKSLKILILSLTLLLPIGVISFLHGFGENKFKRLTLYHDLTNPEYDPGFLKANGCEGNFRDSVHHIPDFSLLNQDGKQVGAEIMKGKIIVADFFFTKCPDICITLSSELIRVQEAFENNPEVMILSHSVDPGNDTPEALHDYAERYGADTEKWIFLTGEKKELYNLIRCGYFVSANEVPTNPDSFIHTDKMVLLDKEGRIRGYYTGTERKDVDRLITEIQILKKEYED